MAAASIGRCSFALIHRGSPGRHGAELETTNTETAPSIARSKDAVELPRGTVAAVARFDYTAECLHERRRRSRGGRLAPCHDTFA